MFRKKAVASTLLRYRACARLGRRRRQLLHRPAHAQGASRRRSNFSKPFVTAARPLQKAITEAAKNPALDGVVQADRRFARSARSRPRCASRLDGQARRADSLARPPPTPPRQRPTTKRPQASFGLNVGVLMRDQAMQEAGLFGLVSSGKVPPEECCQDLLQPRHSGISRPQVRSGARTPSARPERQLSRSRTGPIRRRYLFPRRQDRRRQRGAESGDRQDEGRQSAGFREVLPDGRFLGGQRPRISPASANGARCTSMP